MIVKKIITKDVELDIQGITLLSIEEYEQYKYNIPLLHTWWWLRSPGLSSNDAARVDDGSVDDYGGDVSIRDGAVRPALILNPKSSTLEVGDKLRVKYKTWTVISSRYAICDTYIGEHCFRDDWRASDANDYEASDIKKYIEAWWAR